MLDARRREAAITVKMSHGKIVKLSVPRLDLSGRNLNLSWDLDSTGPAGNILDLKAIAFKSSLTSWKRSRSIRAYYAILLRRVVTRRIFELCTRGRRLIAL
jgi:hypothetical protein